MRDQHIDDLVVLIDEHLQDPEHRAGVTANVGGGVGRKCSRSLLETTELCRKLTGNDVAIEPATETRPADLPIFISDCNWLFGHTSWRPGVGARSSVRSTTGSPICVDTANRLPLVEFETRLRAR